MSEAERNRGMGPAGGEVKIRIGGTVPCGYCPPGMVPTVKALLGGNPSPAEAQIRQAISGHLFRCNGGTGIVAAVARGAARLRGEAPEPPPTGDGQANQPLWRGCP